MEEVYRKLQREINKMPIAYSETISGVELRLLKHLFTPEEAEIALNLNILPETLDRIFKRVKKSGIDINKKKLGDALDRLVQKGAIVGGRFYESKGKGTQYHLAQLAIGMFENQIDQLTRDYVEDFEKYVKEQFHKDALSGKTVQMRTIPISKSVTPEMYIKPYDDIRAYVKKLKGDISVTNCVCRQSNEVLGKKCRHSDIMETCLQFHDFARFIIGKGPGRPITKEEALSILDRAEEAGFVLQPENAREPQFVCCCCTDCCHSLKIMKMHHRPAEIFVSSYYASIDASKCTGCKKCMDKCGMEAISMKDKIAVVNRDRCIGCGVCVQVCPNSAHMLLRKEKTHKPPKTHDDMYKKILFERIGFGGMMKLMAKALTGRKI